MLKHSSQRASLTQESIQLAITTSAQQTQSSEFTQAKKHLKPSHGTKFTSLTGSESGVGPWRSATGSLGSVGFSRLETGLGRVFSGSLLGGCFGASESGVFRGFTLSASRFCEGLVLCCWVALLLSSFWFCWSDSR